MLRSVGVRLEAVTKCRLKLAIERVLKAPDCLLPDLHFAVHI